MTRQVSPAAFSLGVTALVLMLAVVLVAGFLVPRAQWAAQTLGDIEPRHARLLGLRDSAERVLETDRQLQETLRGVAYAASVPADRVGADIQQRVRADAAAAGFTVVGSQIRGAQEFEGFEAVPVSIVLEGSIEHLGPLSERLGEARPALRVVALNVTPMRGRAVTPSRNLRVELSIAAARLVQ